MRLQRACTAKEYVKCAVKSQNAVKYHGDNNGNEALILVYFVRRSRLHRIYGIRVWLSAEAEAQAARQIFANFSSLPIFSPVGFFEQQPANFRLVYVRRVRDDKKPSRRAWTTLSASARGFDFSVVVPNDISTIHPTWNANKWHRVVGNLVNFSISTLSLSLSRFRFLSPVCDNAAAMDEKLREKSRQPFQ